MARASPSRSSAEGAPLGASRGAENYSERQHGEPDVEVQFDYEGRTVTGFIDAGRENDGVWEVWVCFSCDHSGWRATRKDWVPMDWPTLLSVDEVPAIVPTLPDA